MENVYNNNPYPQFIDDTYVNLGISDQTFSQDEGVFTCSFRRAIKNEQYAEKFFNLENPYHALLAKGPLGANGK